MLKQFAEMALQYLNLARDVIQLKDDFKALRQELKETRAEIADLRKSQEQTNRAIERLAYEIRSARDHDESERRLLTVQLENELLKFERRLPPPQN